MIKTLKFHKKDTKIFIEKILNLFLKNQINKMGCDPKSFVY